MTNVAASASYGVYNSAPIAGAFTVTIDNSTITGSTSTIVNDTGFTTRVGATKLSGGTVVYNGGTVTCANVHDENYTAFSSTCP